MEDLEKRRKPLWRQIERSEEDLNKLISDSPKEVDSITALYRTFCDLFSELAILDSIVFEALLENSATPEEEDEKMKRTTSYKRKAEELRIKMDKLIMPAPGGEGNSGSPSVIYSSGGGESRRRLNLPEVKIKPYSGDLLDWLRFWAQFQTIDEDSSLRDSDKFTFLMQSLEAGTEPFQIADGFPQSAENYPKVVEVLKRRYANEDLLLQVYIRELFSLVISNVNSKEKVPFNELFLKLNSHLRALKSLNLEKADPATWFFPLVESSLPEDILYNWQRSSLAKLDGSKQVPPWTRLDILMEFMEKEVEIKQRIVLSKSFCARKPEEVRENTSSSRGRQLGQKPRRTVTSFHVKETSGCVFCGKPNHPSQKCFKAEKMAYKGKKEILWKKKLCYCCFQQHLAKAGDHKNIKCDHCGGHHYSIICGKKKESDDDKASPPAKRQRTEGQDSQTVTRIGMTNQTGSGGEVFL